jgi:hypothetical protein
VTGRLSKMNGEAKPSALTRPQNTPLGITLAPFIPLEITLAYMLLLCATVVLFVPPIQRIVGAIAVLGTASSAAALISVFLLSDAIQQIFAVEMNSPEMQNNPFAGFGKALMQSIRIEPGLALYLLVAVMLSLVVVYRFSALDRVTIAEEKSVATDAGE